MNEIIFPRKRVVLWWCIALIWSFIFIPPGVYSIVTLDSIPNIIVGILTIGSSVYFLRMASYRYIIAADDGHVYFYHKGLFRKKIPWSDVQSFSLHRFSPEADLAITAGTVAGGSTPMSQIYVHLKGGDILSIPSIYFTLENRRNIVERLEEKRNENSHLA